MAQPGCNSGDHAASKVDMSLYYSHNQRRQKRAALEKVAERFASKHVRTEVQRELEREPITNMLQ